MTRLTVSKASKDLAEKVHQVARSGERIVLSDNGEDLAVLVSLEDLAELERLEDLEDERNYAADVAAVEEARAEPGTVPWEQVKTDLGL